MPSVEYAGFGRRALATVIDIIFFLVVTYLVLYALYGQDYFDWVKTNRDPLAVYSTLEAAINNFLPLLITLICWVKLMATPGKLLLGCQVVDAQTLQRIGWGQALLRYLGYIVSILPLGLGFLWIAWDKRKQGFHDKLAKTVVILEDESRVMHNEFEKDWPP